MISHVVLFKPRPDLSPAEREALLDAMRTAFTGIPQIKRVRVGRRRLIGRGYEAQMTVDFEYAAVLEFDDEPALRTYLDHPAHADLGRHFGLTAAAALVYDFSMIEPERIRELLDDPAAS